MRRNTRLAFVAGAAAALALPRAAGGDGVALVLNTKSLPAATVALIDPESGSSGGGGTTDVRVAPGDIILFRFEYGAIPDRIIHGVQGYLTDYVPANTDVVGIRILDASDLAIVPRYPGIAPDDCGATCNGFNAVPCSGGVPGCAGGVRNLDDGSLAGVYADTGVFFTTDSRLARNPATAFLTLRNGIVMSPEPRDVNRIAALLDTSSPLYAHNSWDWIQVRAYGVSSAASGNSGNGNTPFLYGSVVAGPDTYYRYEATEAVPSVIRFDDLVGPWRRIRYPGSQIGSGSPVTGPGPLTRVNLDTTAGWDLRPLNPLPTGTGAVRLALGEIRVGEPGVAEIALRVRATPLDPVHGQDVNCAEVSGGDSAGSVASDNPWPFYIASPNCVYLNLLFDLRVDRAIAVTGDPLNYVLHGKNLSLLAQTGVVVKQKWVGAQLAFVSATGGATVVGDCDGDGLNCLVWPAMSLAPSAEYTFNSVFTVGGGGQRASTMFANYGSARLPAPGFTTQALTVVRAVTLVRATLAVTEAMVPAGGTASLTGTLRNDGTADATYDTLTMVLPSGWTLSGPVTLGGTTLTCTAGSRPTCTVATGFARGSARALAFGASVPAGTPTGLYDVDLQVWASQPGFGPSFETYFPDLATVAVGEPRSTPPAIDCPIVAGAVSISGSTVEADGTVIRVYFNGIVRCTTTATGGRWTCTGFTATFGPLYGGLEVRATADAPSELESPLSAACFVSTRAVCGDGLDNDGDTLVDYPADPGCASVTDNDETDPVWECGDGLDNDGDTLVDFPADPSCSSPTDPTEAGPSQCGDGLDNDGDALVDFPADPGCISALDPDEVSYAACMDGADNDGDTLVDFPADPGCHSGFDASETDLTFGDGVIRARLLLVFDTSGSMNWHTCGVAFTGGDGSTACPGADVPCATCVSSTCGNGLADDSRMAKVKAGIAAAVTAFGEVEFGLMRYHQRPIGFACPTSNASLGSGGWQGGGAAPCAGGFNAGDLLVSFSYDNVADLLAWIDGSSNYPGTPPARLDEELRGSGTTPIAGALASARTYIAGARASDPLVVCRPYRVVLVSDGAETCDGNPVAAAAALLAAGIPVHVIGFATPDPAIIAGLNAIAAAGGTTAAVFADDSVALSAAISAIVSDSILIEYCNERDDDCDTWVDEDFPDKGAVCTNGMLGACLRTGIRVCRPDGLGTICDAPAGAPTPEICNGIDDDCNGLVDDGISCIPCTPAPEVCNGRDDDCDTATDEAPLPGVGNPCGLDIGACTPGALDCAGGRMQCVGATGPSPETCNDIDDNCDGLTDGFIEECYTQPVGCTPGVGCTGECRTGLWICAAGAFGPCAGEVGPVAEQCNGLDDDCDGATDEDWPELGAACDNGLTGLCLATGAWACLPDGSGAFCDAPAVPATTEVCNGADDDCDGATDEDPLPLPIGEPCGGTTPPCTPGTLQCVDGSVQCAGGSGGTAEVCNGADDDCDGLVDEPFLPGTEEPCTDPGFEDLGDTGECEYGATACIGGELACVGYQGPTEEACNALDDDCDGEADDAAECPIADYICWRGSCIGPCRLGEFGCPYGFVCAVIPSPIDAEYCVVDPCRGETCPEGLVPEPDPLGEVCNCVDPCAGVTCLTGEVCQRGVCRDCFDPGLACLDVEVCTPNEEGVGVCVPDPCLIADCNAATEYCVDGDCCPLACSSPCGEGKYCDLAGCAAACRPDGCAGVTCPEGQTCRRDTGECRPDPCAGVGCPPASICHPLAGGCVPDPCLRATCPEGTSCVVLPDGQPACVEPPIDVWVLATGSGGCACGVADSRPAGPAAALFLLVLGGLAGRPRRRAGGAGRFRRPR